MNFFPNIVLLVFSGLLVAVTGFFMLGSKRQRVRAKTRRLVLAFLLVLISLRPTVGESEVTTYSPGVDVVILVDRTTSMAAEDWAGGQPRLAGVKDDLTKIIGELTGSRFSIIVFDNSARVAMPFTTDQNAAVSLLDAIGWREVSYGTGTDISIAVTLAKSVLEESLATHPGQSRYLIYAGDGEQTKKQPPQSFASLSPLIDGGLVLGYGTKNGGPMKERITSDEYVKQNGEIVKSVINEANLRKIADELQVIYEHKTTISDTSMPVIGKTMVATTRKDPRGFELYWIIAGIGLVVLAFDMSENIRRIKLVKGELL